jgi:hypothetical protein
MRTATWEGSALIGFDVPFIYNQFQVVILSHPAVCSVLNSDPDITQTIFKVPQ